MEQIPEEWKPVVGYEGFYEVSSLGNVRSVITKWGNPRRRPLKPRRHTGGYMRVNLCRNNTGAVDFYIHDLVLTAFVGPCPDGHERNHKDGRKANNAADNLEYVTRSQNMIHAMDTGLYPVGSKHGNAKLTEADVKEIRALRATQSPFAIAERFGVSYRTIHRIVKRQRWKRAG